MRVFVPTRIPATALALALLTACSLGKDKDDPTPTTKVSWTVDGNNITAISASGQITGNMLGLSASHVTTGSNPVASSVSFSNMPRATGTYDLSSTSAPVSTGALGYYTSDGDTYTATSGSVVITSLGTSNMVGTFSFTVRRLNSTVTKTISNGKFDVDF